MFASEPGRGSVRVLDRSPVRLVHVTTVPLTLWAFLRGHSCYLRELGWELHAVSSTGPLLDAFASATSVPIHPVEMVRSVSPLHDLSATRRLHSLFRRLAPDIVHAHTPKAGLLAMLAATSAGVPLRIYHLHGLRFPTCRGVARWSTLWGERIACRMAHHVLCVSSSLRREAIANRLVRGDRISVPGAGSIAGVDAVGRFDPARFPAIDRAAIRRAHGIPEGAWVVGFVGRIVRDKGIVELTRAWSALRASFPDLHLLIVGPTEDYDPLPASTLQLLRRDPQIHLTGEVLDPAPFLSLMNVLALPSHREGFGVVLLEAAALEVPVIASRVTGCVDAVEDSATGTLISPGDEQALANAIRRYREDPELCRRHGRAGRARALRSFKPEDSYRSVVAEYRATMARLGLANSRLDRSS